MLSQSYFLGVIFAFNLIQNLLSIFVVTKRTRTLYHIIASYEKICDFLIVNRVCLCNHRMFFSVHNVYRIRNIFLDIFANTVRKFMKTFEAHLLNRKNIINNIKIYIFNIAHRVYHQKVHFKWDLHNRTTKRM